MIFGSNRDFNLLVGLQRELLHDIVEQEILYYKIDLQDTEANLYGEATDKTYWEPVKLNCLVTRGEQTTSSDEMLTDRSRDASFAFIRKDLVDVTVVPEVGDIILWQEDYFEIDNVVENQLFVGRDNSYNLTDYGKQHGSSNSIICQGHLTRKEGTGINFSGTSY